MGNVAQVCVKLSWHKKFIVTITILNPTPIMATRSVRYLGPELRRASGSMTLRPQFRSGCEHNLNV